MRIFFNQLSCNANFLKFHQKYFQCADFWTRLNPKKKKTFLENNNLKINLKEKKQQKNLFKKLSK